MANLAQNYNLSKFLSIDCFSPLHGYFTPLTTNDDYTSHRNSAAHYQLAQSILKIGCALTERKGQGEVSGCTALADMAWRLLQLL